MATTYTGSCGLVVHTASDGRGRGATPMKHADAAAGEVVEYLSVLREAIDGYRALFFTRMKSLIASHWFLFVMWFLLTTSFFGLVLAWS